MCPIAGDGTKLVVIRAEPSAGGRRLRRVHRPGIPAAAPWELMSTADVCVNPDRAHEMNDKYTDEQDSGVHGARQAHRPVRLDRGDASRLDKRRCMRAQTTSRILPGNCASCATTLNNARRWARSEHAPVATSLRLLEACAAEMQSCPRAK
jgi:hypothetical protein